MTGSSRGGRRETLPAPALRAGGRRGFAEALPPSPFHLLVQSVTVSERASAMPFAAFVAGIGRKLCFRDV